MRTTIQLSILVLLLSTGAMTTVRAQDAPGNRRFQRGDAVPARAVSAEERAEILGEIAIQLRQGYVFADEGAAFADAIARDLAAGRFEDYERLDAFAAAVGDYLFELSNDKHLRVWGAATPAAREVDTASDHRPARRTRPTGGGASHGFQSYERLDGDIAYIDLRSFSGDPDSKSAADEAMTALAGAEALILDLRRNRGGSPFMVRYLSGFLFAEPTHLASTMMRDWDEPAERWTLQEGLPTRAFVDTPVYVLTSRGTFSAAESFTFGLKINDRITQVGERTGGGGHWGSVVTVGDGLEMFLPQGRTYDPATGLGWEAEGLEPDIEVPTDEALDAALAAIRGT